MMNRAEIQKQFADYVREGDLDKTPPLDIELRRIKIYKNLIYKNIESFLSGNFPVLRTILADDFWWEIVSAFLKNHRASSPYFKDIAEEFLVFLNQDEPIQQGILNKAPPFTLELAHYEWVELVLDIRDEQWPTDDIDFNFSEHRVIRFSPLAWSLAYHYPVHQISVQNQPEQPSEQPTCLVVYRSLQDKVCFMQINPLTAQMLAIIQNTPNELTAKQLMEQLAEQLQLPIDNIYQHGVQMLDNFCEKAILGCVSQ